MATINMKAPPGSGLTHVILSDGTLIKPDGVSPIAVDPKYRHELEKMGFTVAAAVSLTVSGGSATGTINI